MAPRTGIRGVTINDVADVADQGSSVMRGGYTFTRGNRPAPSSFTVPKVEDLISGMTGLRLDTAGKRYSGFPTATQQEAAVIGSIEPFYEIGRYARQLAGQRQEDIQADAADRIRQAFGQKTPILYSNPRSPVSIPGIGGVAPITVAAQNELDPAYQAAKLAANKAWTEMGISRITRGAPERLTELQDLIDNGLELYPQEKTEYENLLAGQRAAYADSFAKQQAAEKAQADLALLSRSLTSSRLAGATGESAAARQRIGEEVTPQLELAQEIEQTPRYELAQKMATQYFGMDPNIAAATFTPQMDIDYMEMQRDLQTEQNLAAGIDPNASIADTLLRLDPSGERLQQYQEELAAEAERKFAEGQRTEDEEAFDLNIEVATGIPVSEAAGDYSLATARQYLIDNDFLASVDNARNTMSEQSALSVEDRKRIADNLAAQYLDQNPADPVGARILLNILYGYTFTIPTS